ncbi:MAG: NYN domain-containing protein [Acidimicrobiaceae bacterium]|nr:NYN domain-containing protein [Acidimicrobiaceae bacterium]
MAPDVPEDQDPAPDLVTRAVDHGLLRPALELAVLVARNGADERPPIPPPGPLRPLLRHTRWTPRARMSVARTIEADDEFRMRVAEKAEKLDADHLDDASRLWLVRPEGWREELAEAVNERDAEEDERRADRDERKAQRQLVEVSAELDRRREEAEVAIRRAADLETELGEARRERRETLARAEALGEQLATAQTEAERWRKSAEEAACLVDEHRRALEEARREATALEEEERRLRERIAGLEFELADAEARQEADQTATADLRQSVARAVGEAASAAAALGEALAGAARSIVERASLPADSPEPPSRPAPEPTDGVADSGVAESPAPPVKPVVKRTSERTTELRRQPLPLPPAVFDDSPEAAEHLVRSGVLLLVDGYNVSLFAWRELPLPAQRHRLTASLAELAFRTGASIRVIFDGDEQVAYPEWGGGARNPVRVLFSTPGVKADEVIISAVDEHPPDRPVVVATNDREVQDEVRRRGANVITTPQLLGLLRRAGVR